MIWGVTLLLVLVVLVAFNKRYAWCKPGRCLLSLFWGYYVQ